MYHLRVLVLMLYHIALILLRSGGLRRPSEEVTTTHVVTLTDLDWNMHQNNSVYALELDIARYPFLVQFIGGRRPFLFPMWTQGWSLANGAVATFFYAPLLLHQVYSIRTHLAGVDRKWLYLVSFYTSAGGGVVFACSVSRVVFKQGRRTLPPRDVMATLGYSEADIAALEALGAPALPKDGASAAEVLLSAGPCMSATGDLLRTAAAAPLQSGARS